MEPLREFMLHILERSLEEYLDEGAPAVLIADVLGGGFVPIEGEPGDTSKRISFCEDQKGKRKRRITGSTSYMVLPIVGKQRESVERLLLGCDEHCDLVVGDASVSRKHAWVKRQGKDYFLEDNHSTGGTYINGDRLPPGMAQQILSWNRITLGSLNLTFFDPIGFYNFVQRFRGL